MSAAGMIHTSGLELVTDVIDDGTKCGLLDWYSVDVLKEGDEIRAHVHWKKCKCK